AARSWAAGGDVLRVMAGDSSTARALPASLGTTGGGPRRSVFDRGRGEQLTLAPCAPPRSAPFRRPREGRRLVLRAAWRPRNESSDLEGGDTIVIDHLQNDIVAAEGDGPATGERDLDSRDLLAP